MMTKTGEKQNRSLSSLINDQSIHAKLYDTHFHQKDCSINSQFFASQENSLDMVLWLTIDHLHDCKAKTKHKHLQFQVHHRWNFKLERLTTLAPFLKAQYDKHIKSKSCPLLHCAQPPTEWIGFSCSKDTTICFCSCLYAKSIFKTISKLFLQHEVRKTKHLKNSSRVRYQ